MDQAEIFFQFSLQNNTALNSFSLTPIYSVVRRVVAPDQVELLVEKIGKEQNWLIKLCKFLNICYHAKLFFVVCDYWPLAVNTAGVPRKLQDHKDGEECILISEVGGEVG